MKSNRVGISALLVAMLLLAVAVVPVSAQKQVSDIGTKEKEMEKKLAQNKDSQIDQQKAEEIRKELDKTVRKDIENSLRNVTTDVRILSWDTVNLGTDRTFLSADYGNKGSGTWGVAPWWYGSDYYLSSRKAEASSLVGPAGVGGVNAWSYAGKQFYVSGTGSRSANIRMAGHIWGLTTSALSATSYAEINLVLWDASTATRYSTNIYTRTEGGAGWTEANFDFNNGLGVNLQSGHYYIAYLELITEATVYGSGEAGSDFGRFDGDYSGEGVWYNSIIVDF
ncbi:MAG: hypothetical protein O8C63_12505 [Candidatus Methanoperedens sp.]|nr:hypothetical protein [Candidatus Methanoperedens sp.]